MKIAYFNIWNIYPGGRSIGIAQYIPEIVQKR
jgi:hypothetical protein